MDVTFTVTNQKLVRTDTNLIVSGSENYLFAAFTFSSDWANAAKEARFWHRLYNVAYTESLVNNRCEVPKEVLKNGEFCVAVYGGDIQTANVVMVPVCPCGWSEAVENTPPPVN
jgi:hypothetical protein